MKFGARVWVRRGSQCFHNGLGGGRLVPGVLVGARGKERLVRLTQDDPQDTVGWRKAGDVGQWSASAVEEVDPMTRNRAERLRRRCSWTANPELADRLRIRTFEDYDPNFLEPPYLRTLVKEIGCALRHPEDHNDYWVLVREADVYEVAAIANNLLEAIDWLKGGGR